jgi:hypothetical protein
MVSKTFFLCAVLSLAVFGAAAHQTRMLNQVEPLQLQDYNMTREAYVNFTSDTQFANYLELSILIYTQLYSITARNKKFSSGNLTFTFDANETISSIFGDYIQSDKGLQGSIQIINNEPTNVVLPDDDIQTDKDAIKKLVLAYVKYVALGQVSFQVALPDEYVDYDLLKIMNPTSSYNSALVPDINIKFHDFNTNLTNPKGVNGTINFKIDAYSKFLSFTPRYRGKVLTFFNVPATIQLNGETNVTTIIVEEAAIKPYPIRDLKELINAYYLSYALPLINNLFA